MIFIKFNFQNISLFTKEMAHPSTDMEDDYSELAIEIQSCMSGVNRLVI
jgi:hypothetical protein